MLSSRARYASRAILDLCQHAGETVLIGDVARRQNVPLKFLQQILVTLKGAGFVASRKGPGGGYALVRRPEAITLGEVIRATDDLDSALLCGRPGGPAECGCPRPDACVLRERFREARDAMAAALERTTFAELAEAQRRADGLPSALDFVI